MNAGTETTNAQRRSVFSRVLVGIGGSEESREAHARRRFSSTAN